MDATIVSSLSRMATYVSAIAIIAVNIAKVNIHIVITNSIPIIVAIIIIITTMVITPGPTILALTHQAS
jgi:hypothetical protein